MEQIAKGAEAAIYVCGGKIIKKRLKKGYRIKELDAKLRSFRTKREVKILKKLRDKEMPVPKVLETDVESSAIHLELVAGEKVRDGLNADNCEALGKAIGKLVGSMHSSHVVHGDLTTSNMICDKRKIYFIDFGLSFFSEKIEDKAVDIHLLKQTLKSSHSRIAEKCFAAVTKGYLESYGEASSVAKRLGDVESRGRYKSKSKARK